MMGGGDPVIGDAVKRRMCVYWLLRKQTWKNLNLNTALCGIMKPKSLCGVVQKTPG
jgi:hypothetical protein